MKRLVKALCLFLSIILLVSTIPAHEAEAATVKLNAKKKTMLVGETFRLTLSGAESTTSVIWASSRKSVATVSDSGLVTAKKKGKAVITASYNGRAFTCKITVKKAKKGNSNSEKSDVKKNETSENAELQGIILSKSYSDKKIDTAGEVTMYSEWYSTNSTLSCDDLGLALSLSYADTTNFSNDLPDGYDPEELLEWGKYPGLNIDILHKYGFTGKGTVVAYIDQTVQLPFNDSTPMPTFIIRILPIRSFLCMVRQYYLYS